MAHTVEGARPAGFNEAIPTPRHGLLVPGQESLPLLQGSVLRTPEPLTIPTHAAPRFSRRVLLEAVALAAATEATKTLGFSHHSASAADIRVLAPNSNLSIVRYAPEPKVNLKSAEIPGRSGESNYGLPVTDTGEDIRIIGFTNTKIENDPSLHTVPGIPVDKIGLHYADPENKYPERNRRDLLVASALWRAYELAQTMIDPQTGEIIPSKVRNFALSGKVPQDPNWENCVVRQQSGEPLILPLMALPEGADPIVDALEPYNFNILDGVILNYTGRQEYGMIKQQYVDLKTKEPAEGWSYERSGKQLKIHIWNNSSKFVRADESPKMTQVIYDLGVGQTTLRALMSLMTLGVHDTDGRSMFGGYFINSFSNVIAENSGMTIFPEHVDLAFTELSEETVLQGLPGRLFKVKFLE